MSRLVDPYILTPPGGGPPAFFGDPFDTAPIDSAKWDLTLGDGWTAAIVAAKLEFNAIGSGPGTTITRLYSHDVFDFTDKTLEVEFKWPAADSSPISEGHYLIVTDGTHDVYIGGEQGELYGYVDAVAGSDSGVQYVYLVDKLRIQHFSSDSHFEIWAHTSGTWNSGGGTGWKLIGSRVVAGFNLSSAKLGMVCYEYHGTAITTPSQWWNLITDIPV